MNLYTFPTIRLYGGGFEFMACCPYLHQYRRNIPKLRNLNPLINSTNMLKWKELLFPLKVILSFEFSVFLFVFNLFFEKWTRTFP